MNTLQIFCDVDDFCGQFAQIWHQHLLAAQPKLQNRKFGLCLSEVMTIVIQFHISGYRTFKAYYIDQILTHQRAEFSGLVSYNRFVELLPQIFVPLCVYFKARFGCCSGAAL